MFRRFLRDKTGSVLPIFAIAAVPLIVATGGVVDYSRAFDQVTVVQDSMDSAALAAGKKIGLISDTAVEAEADAIFVVNVGTKVDNLPTLGKSIVASTITLTTTLHVPTYFLGMIGIDEFIFPLEAEATLAMGTLEVALVLDNSGSMSGTKIAALIDAATDLTETLYSLGGTSTLTDPVKVALVPFASSVKIDPANKTAAWMDQTGVAPYNAESFEGYTGSPPVSNNTPASLNVLNMFDTLSGSGSAWAGCVEERQAPYDVQDDEGSTATPATMFVPMFAPDEPDNWTCTTSTCTKSCDADLDGSSCNSSSAGLRYNGAPTGTKDYNNYLPDEGTTGTCNATTISMANAAVVTSTGHGLTAGTPVLFQTSGALYTGLSTGTPYYVSAANLTANAFEVSATAPASAITFTVTKANPAVFTRSSHGLTAGRAIALTTTGDMYDPLTPATTYYVISSGLTSSTFRVSTTVGGSAVSTLTGGSQSGTHKYVRLVTTTGSQSGTHRFTVPANYSCSNGSAGCGSGSVGKSEQTALLGQNVASQNLCKYGTVASKAAIASISVDTNGGTYPGGPNFNCTTQQVTPLTATEATVTAAIGTMAANGTTNITGGLMWGWRALSPTAPMTESRPYSTLNNQKILILLTDGENTYFANSKFNVSHYGAWGYVWKNHLGTTSSSESTMQGKMEERMALACSNIKASGVEIYTIGFQITDQATLDLLSACATTTSMAYQSDNTSELTAAFTAIGDDISLLRLAH